MVLQRKVNVVGEREALDIHHTREQVFFPGKKGSSDALCKAVYTRLLRTKLLFTWKIIIYSAGGGLARRPL